LSDNDRKTYERFFGSAPPLASTNAKKRAAQSVDAHADLDDEDEQTAAQRQSRVKVERSKVRRDDAGSDPVAPNSLTKLEDDDGEFAAQG
jgi:hypothetical protein